MLTKPETTRKQTYLYNNQKWAIASYCIENRCVIQDIDPRSPIKSDTFYPYTIWRVTPSKTAEEINNTNLEEVNLPKITAYHVKASVEFLNEVSKFTGKYPEPKAIQDTVEMDQMAARIATLENTNKKVELAVSELRRVISQQAMEIDSYKQILHSISKLIPAQVFSKK